jgi:hypothetical protein
MKTMKAIVVTDQAAGTAMQLPILVTACRSRLREMESRLRRCAGLRAREQVAWARMVKLSSSKHPCQSKTKPS